MRLRDRPHALVQQIWVFQNVSASVIERIPSAYQRAAADPSASALRTRWPARLRSGQVAADQVASLIDASIEHTSTTLSPVALIAQSRDLGYRGLPLTVTISGSSVAINVAHGVFDGAAGLELVRHLLSLAAGVDHSLDSGPLARWPLLTSIRSAPRGSLRKLLDQRRVRDEARPAARSATPADLALRNASFASFVLDPEVLKSVSSAKDLSPNPVRLTRNNRLCSLVVDSLKAVYSGTVDLPIEIPVDLRRFAGPGRVEGNFVCADVQGTLLGSEWGPSEISRRLAASIASGTPVLSMTASMLGPAKAAILGKLRRSKPDTGHYAVSVSMLGEKTDFPPEIWAPGEAPLFGCATVSPWPSSTFALIATTGATVRISFWDDTALFDLTRIEAAFQAEVARRATPVS